MAEFVNSVRQVLSGKQCSLITCVGVTESHVQCKPGCLTQVPGCRTCCAVCSELPGWVSRARQKPTAQLQCSRARYMLYMLTCGHHL